MLLIIYVPMPHLVKDAQLDGDTARRAIHRLTDPDNPYHDRFGAQFSFKGNAVWVFARDDRAVPAAVLLCGARSCARTMTEAAILEEISRAVKQRYFFNKLPKYVRQFIGRIRKRFQIFVT